MKTRKRKRKAAPKRKAAKRKAAKRKPKRARALKVRFSATVATRIREASKLVHVKPQQFVFAAVIHFAFAHSRLAQLYPTKAPNALHLPITAVNVIAIASSPNVAKFHGDRAFIASVWDHWPGPNTKGSLADFKHSLVTLWRAGKLRLTRADLVGAMDPNMVRRSETTYEDTDFHFVAL